MLPLTFLVSLFVGWVLPAATQDPTQQDPVEQSAVQEMLLDLRGRLETVADETARAALAAQLDAVTRQLEATDAFAAQTKGFAELSSEAPDRLAAIEQELAQPPTEGSAVAPEGADLALLESLSAQARANLDAARQRLAELEAETATRAARSSQLTADLARFQVEERDLSEQIAAASPPGELAEEVRRLERHAQLLVLRAELAADQAELASYEARAELLPKRRQRASRRVTELEQEVASWRLLVAAENAAANQRAQEEAARLAQEAAAQNPLVLEVVNETQSWISRVTGEEGLAAALARYQERATEALQQDKELRRSIVTARRKLKAAGLSDSMGRVLRREYDRLPDPSRLKDEIRSLSNSFGETQFALLEAEERQYASEDVVARLSEYATSHAEGLTPSEQAGFESALRAALEQRKEQLDRGVELLSKSVETQERLLATLRSLRQTSLEYRTFIGENILYVPSAKPGLPSLGEVATAGSWLLSPGEWNEGLTSAWSSVRTEPRFGVLTLLALALVLVAMRAWFHRRLAALAEATRQFQKDSFVLTVRALFLTALLTVPLSLVLWAFAAAHADLTTGVTRSFGLACGRMAPGVLVVLGMYTLARPKGVFDAHFRWSSKGLASLRRELGWSIPVVFVLVLAFRTLTTGPDESYWNGLGRLITIVLWVLFAILSCRLLWPGTPLLQDALRSGAHGLLARTHRFWSRAFTLWILSHLAISLLGYQYTAWQFSDRTARFMGLVLGLLVIRGLMTRWQFLARRRLAVEQARQRARVRAEARAEAAEKEGDEVPAEEALDENAVNIPAVDAQTTRLFNAAISAALAIGTFLIWSSMLPALGVLERIEIWPELRIVEESTELQSVAAQPPAEQDLESQQTDASRAPLPPGVPPLANAPTDGSARTPVSVRDLIIALLILLATGILTRDVPGLLEIGVLRRLPLDAGLRYAVTTIVRYAIILIGITAGMGAVEIGWSTVQWLAAALTFGLAFGLQEIFANFVSGIIILLERPVRVGDFVTVDNIEGQVTRLRMRATTITDWDRRELLVPNKSFITGSLINWSLSDSVTRVVIPVGIAYGSDVRKAQEKLLEVAAANDDVLDDPAPSAIFVEFGDSSLLLKLRVYMANRGLWPRVINALNLAIDDAFREAEIEIAFPQRDLHLRSADPEVSAALFPKKKAARPD